jgi:hypothetical protein
MWWVRTYYEKDDCVIGECSVATIGQLLHLKDKTRHYYEGDATAAVMAGLDIE